ncbi:MAG: cyclic nucleotide-binding domain-containing protein [Chloroflexi bacterium]|nr:cyclic nucleotide-binding domain-containing protein [Chloroflexota bacterium]
MSDPFLITHLKNLPLFTQLTQPQLSLIAEITQVHRLAPGTLVAQEGQPSTGMIVFVSGRALITRRRGDGFEEQIGAVGGGQYFNEASLYENRRETVSMRIVEPSVVLFIPREAFLRVMGRHTELRANLRVPQVNPPPTTAPPAASPAPRASAQTGAPPVAPQPTGSPAVNFTRRTPMGLDRAAAPRPDEVIQAYTPQPAVQQPVQPAVAVAADALAAAPARVVGASLFRGQRPDEQILYVFRRHWWAFGRRMWIPILLAVLLLIGAIYVGSAAPALSVAALALMVIVPGLISTYLYFEWRDDSIVLTDQRIVRIWRHLIGFENSVSEIPLDRVLEVSTSVPPGDPFAQLFQYATLYIRTAGDAANLELDLITHASNLQSLIFAQRDQFRNRAIRQQQNVLVNDIQNVLGAAPTAQVNVPAAPVISNTPIPLESVDNVGLPFIRTRKILPSGEIIYRRHGSIWLRHVFLPSLLMLAGLVLIIVSLTSPLFQYRGIIGISAGIAICMVAAVWFFMADWDWRNDTLVIGLDAITITHKRPLWLQNEVERIRLLQVDKVASEKEGLINTLLNRGEIRISLLGSAAKDTKIFDNVHDPESIQGEVSRRMAALRMQRQTEGVEEQRQVILDYLAAYHQMQGGAQTAPPGQVQPGMSFNAPTQGNTPYNTQGGPPAMPPSDNVRPPRVPRPRDGS